VFGLLIVLVGHAVAAGDAVAAGAAVAGKDLYGRVCQTCHGPAGEGDGPGAAGFVLRPRPFSRAAFKFDTDSDWVKGSDVDLANVIRNGAAAYGGSALMTPWPMYSDEQVADLVAYVRELGPARAVIASAGAFGFSQVYMLLSEHCGACHVRGVADGPWSLDTPPTQQRYPECLEVEASEQLKCATYHQLVDPPVPGVPAWIRPTEAAVSEPYAQACDPDNSFHIGHSLPTSLAADQCSGFLGWIEAGAAPD